MTHVPTVIISRTAAALAGLGKRVEIPTKLGSVSLIKPLGEGGMSVVHLGRHEILQKNVAVKFLLDIPASENDPRFTSFIEGARAAAAIKHEGLNVVYHADSVQNLPYLVMELIEGPSLTDLLLKHGPMPLGVACGIMEKVCDAVGELHHHGIIHRDIKPANIMIDPSGRVIVTDFGLAMERPAAHFGGAVGTLAGTPAYMAPEMFDATVSTRTDVYAIGVTLFELLTGKPSFAGDFQEMRFAHRSTPLPVAPLAERGVPEGLIVVIERAMHKDVLFRPKSARHVLDAMIKACEAAGIRRADVAKIQRYIEIGAGGEHATSTGATPAPAYYERLGTLAEVKRRTPDGTLIGGTPPPSPLPSPTPVIAAPSPAAAIVAAPAATPPASAIRAGAVASGRSSVLPISPAIAIPVLAVLGAVGLSFTFHLVTEMYDQIVLFYERMNWLRIDSRSAGIFVDGRIVPGRMSWPLALAANGAPIVIGLVAPLVLLWYPYVRLVLGRPPRDGVTRCGWCRHAMTGVRDLRCPECGRLATTRGETGERPVALRWETHIKYYAVAGAVLIVALMLWLMPYVWMVRIERNAPFTASSVLALVGLLLPATAASLLALHFFARSTSWLTGRTYCGKCGGDLCTATGPQCPGCGAAV